MNRRTTILFRKALYAGGICVLLFPLYWLGKPETYRYADRDQGGARGGAQRQIIPGGLLAQKRREMGLSPAELGEIDPASQTMKLATLGLRGVATWMLWSKIDDYQEHESWEKLSATLNTLRRLNPHYLSVWEYQAWNVSYNISREFDRYEHRYQWVKRGIDHLLVGTRYNRHSPRLFWSLGWFTGHKLGQSDEHTQFRRLFRDDNDFHATLNDYIRIDSARDDNGRPDNWLCARLWYLRSIAVDERGIPSQWRIQEEDTAVTKRKRSAVLFYHDPARARIAFAEAVTDERDPGEVTRLAWSTGGKELKDFATRDIMLYDGLVVRLDALEQHQATGERLAKKLDELLPGIREEIVEERKAKFKPEERAAFETPPAQRNMMQQMLADNAQRQLFVHPEDILARAPKEKQIGAREIVQQLNHVMEMISRIKIEREIINFDYWINRCQVEQEKETAEARRLIRTAVRRWKEQGDPEGAVKSFEKAWDLWAKVFDAHPELISDVMGEDLAPFIEDYATALSQIDQPFPQDFKLKRLREFYQRSDDFSEMEATGRVPSSVPR